MRLVGMREELLGESTPLYILPSPILVSPNEVESTGTETSTSL